MTDNTNLTEQERLDTLKSMSDVLTRDVSRRLDEINSHLNAVDLALEAIIELYNKTIEQHTTHTSFKSRRTTQ